MLPLLYFPCLCDWSTGTHGSQLSQPQTADSLGGWHSTYVSQTTNVVLHKQKQSIVLRNRDDKTGNTYHMREAPQVEVLGLGTVSNVCGTKCCYTYALQWAVAGMWQRSSHSSMYHVRPPCPSKEHKDRPSQAKSPTRLPWYTNPLVAGEGLFADFVPLFEHKNCLNDLKSMSTNKT